jgi:hypothetical protein
MKTKFILSLAFFVCSSATLFAQANNWQWARCATIEGSSEGMSIATDAAGNVYETGFFMSSTITFGTILLTNAGPPNAEDIFLVKYDYNGNLLWAKSANGVGQAWGMCADSAGNTYITGWFNSSTITFGSITLSLANGGFFIAKYDPNGNAIWAKSTTGANNDGYGFSASADKNGNVFVGGWFSSPTFTLGSVTLTNTGSIYTRDFFLVKYDSNGNTLWAKNGGGTNDDFGNSVSADLSGNVVITGVFKDSICTIGSTNLVNAGYLDNDIFLAKYDANGNVIWALRAGGIDWDDGNSVSIDRNGNVFLAGEFGDSSITFGTTTLVNSNLINNSYDAFLVKYDPNGNVIWAKKGIGTNSDFGYSVSADTSGNAYMTGEFLSSTIIFGSITLTRPPGSTDPIYIVKYDPNGNVLCGAALASGGDDQDAVSADRLGNAYIGGDYYFDPFIVGSDTLPPPGGEDVFVAKYNCNLDAGVNEFTNEENISVFPNPSNGIFTLKWDMGQMTSDVEKNCVVEIYNVLGEEIFEQKIISQKGQAQKTEIDLSNESNGIYFVTVKNENKSFTQKIIIQK